MADLVRNSLFPSCEEMAALAAQFGVLPGGGGLDLLDPGLSPRPEGEVSRSHTPVPPGNATGEVSRSHTPVPPGNVTGEVRRRRRKRMKMPLLDMENRWYERMICERKDQETINHIDRNIVSYVTEDFHQHVNLLYFNAVVTWKSVCVYKMWS